MKYVFSPRGVCSRQIILDIEDNKIKDCEFIGGCNGNLKGICKLIKNLEIPDVIEKLEGITCNNKSTSCPDQLAQALKEYLNKL
ncbi:MAG: TIGR03905 family TSCPD domain-containing protein [Oscillospiraceae bacterium]|nr:TIGR03905 family TSCPD domain-containing protein [Oscillospiraceae bacterium]